MVILKILLYIFAAIGIICTIIAFIAYFYGGKINIRLGKINNEPIIVENEETINKPGNEPNIERRTILDELYTADDNYSDIRKSEEKPDNKIINKLKWLYNTLKLSELNNTRMLPYTIYNGENLRGFSQNILFTSRQIRCIESVFNALHNNRFNTSYHELCDFIDNYQLTMSEPINIHEKILLKLAIEEFLRKEQ